jgi:hypothetical protein
VLGDEVATYLAGAGIGMSLSSTSGWIIFGVPFPPEAPNAAACVIEYGGSAPVDESREPGFSENARCGRNSTLTASFTKRSARLEASAGENRLWMPPEKSSCFIRTSRSELSGISACS